MFTKVNTLCPTIDKLLTHGIESRAVTLITGPEGSGKTQLCLQLAFSLQLPTNLGDSELRQTIIIQPHMSFPFDRLQEISLGALERLKDKYAYLSACSSYKQALYGIPRNITFENTSFQYMDSSSALLKFCTNFPKMIEERKIRLLVLDKFDELLLKKSPCDDYVHPNEMLPKIMQIVQRISWKFNIAVVITVEQRAVYSLPIYHDILSKLQEYCNYHMRFMPCGANIIEAKIIKSPCFIQDAEKAKFLIKKFGLCEPDSDPIDFSPLD